MKFWTIKKQKELVVAFLSGKKVSEIASDYGMPRSVVAGLLHSLGVVKPDGYTPRKDRRDRAPYNNYYTEHKETVIDYGEQ